MSKIMEFNNFLNKGTVKKQSPDKSRAEFLLKESEQDYRFILQLESKFEITDENANTFIKNCHEILMQLVRAKMLIDGYNASGYRAHEAEVSYLKILKFNENEVQFADQLRFFRNGMLYYGTILDKVYAEKVLKFLKDIYPRLKDLILKED